MKRLVCILLLVALMVTMFAACGGSFVCDLCGQEKTGKRYEGAFFGQEIEYCKDCKKGLEELGNLFS